MKYPGKNIVSNVVSYTYTNGGIGGIGEIRDGETGKLGDGQTR